MPHLSPMSWINTMIMVWLILSILGMVNWWSNSTITKISSKPSSANNIVSPW